MDWVNYRTDYSLDFGGSGRGGGRPWGGASGTRRIVSTIGPVCPHLFTEISPNEPVRAQTLHGQVFGVVPMTDERLAPATNYSSRPLMEGNSNNGSPPLQVDPKWYTVRLVLSRSLITQRNSMQVVLRAFLPPIKNDDASFDFYTVYKKEVTEYDVDFIKEYDEDLNTTLISVRHLLFALAVHLICSRRPVCSLSSAQRSLSMSNRTRSPTRRGICSPPPCH